MAALAAAVRPFAGGVPRRAAPAPPDTNERASGTMPRRVVAPARDPSVCLAGGVEELYVPSHKRKMTTCLHNNVVETAAGDTKVKVSTVGGETSSARELLQKRLASELDVLRFLLKKAEVISRRGACNGAAPATAGNDNKEQWFLASDSKQRSEPMEGGGGGNAPSLKRRKVSTLVEEKQKQVRPPRMSAEERHQIACRLSSLSGEVPGQIVEFLLKQFGDADADAGGEIEINVDSVEDSVLFEMKTQLDKFAAQERPIVVDDVLPEEKDDEKLAEESKVKVKGVLAQEVKTGSRPSSSSSSSGSDTGSDSACKSDDSDEFPTALSEQIIATSAQPPSEPPAPPGAAAQSGGEAKAKAQDVHRAAAAPRSVSLAGLIYRAKVRRELVEMEKTVLPDERIHPWDLQRLGIAEYGHPSLMRQLGLFLKADDA